MAPRRSDLVRLLLTLTMILGIGGGVAAAAPPAYTLTDLGNGVFPYDLNSSGTIVGEMPGPVNPGIRHAFVYQDGVPVDLGILPDQTPDTAAGSSANAINEAGDIVGVSGNGNGTYGQRAVLWSGGGSPTNLGLLDAGGGAFSYASAINNAGVIVGITGSFTLSQRGFVYAAGSMNEAVPGSRVEPFALNDAGRMVGVDPVINEAVYVEGGVVTPLALPMGCSTSLATAVNSAGDVVGYGSTCVGEPFRAVLWTGGSLIELGSLAGTPIQILRDINASGQIVGSTGSGYPSVDARAVLYDQGVAYDLNDLIPAEYDILLNIGTAINDRGQIVGVGLTGEPGVNAEGHGFLLTPVNVCGDGAARGAEQCDDGGTVAGDGCDADCSLEPVTVSNPATPPGGTVDLDVGAVGATPAQPVQAAVTTPSGGAVSVTRTNDDTLQPGFRVRGALVQISAPDETPATPLQLVFRVDASLLSPGETAATLVVTRNGAVAGECPGSAVASPDPCVSARAQLGDGDAQLTVLTSQASTWGLATDLCGALPATTCKTPIGPGRAQLALKRGATVSKDQLAWKWGKGASTGMAELGTPTAATDYALCVYDESGGVPTRRLRVVAGGGAMCGTKPCWKAGKNGFQFKQKLASGTLQVQLKAGAAGKSQIKVAAKGAVVGLPALPLSVDPRVRVQLRNGDGFCWEASFGAPKTNDTGSFAGKSN